MNEIKLLTALELRSLYGINRLRYTKDKKQKRNMWLLTAVWGLLLAMVFAYTAGLVYGLCLLGLASIVPAYLTVFATLLIFVFELFKAGNTLFGNRGYDILSSMPLHVRSVVTARFLGMYMEDLILTAVIMLPGLVTFFICANPGIVALVVLIFGVLFIPAVPLVLATLIGTLIMALSARMKHKSMMQSVLLIGFVIAVLLVSVLLPTANAELSVEQITVIASDIGGLFGKIYPPAAWLGEAALLANIPNLLFFIGVSVLPMLASLWIASHIFDRVMRRLQSVSAKSNYQMGELQSRGLLRTLYLRECKRYFSSSIYVTNTIIGPIMGTLASAALMIAGKGRLLGAVSIPIDLLGLLPFVFAGIFCMMTTTSVSISMEGSRFWIVKSLPIPVKTLLDSKILLNLSLMAPFWLASKIMLMIALRPRLIDALWLILIPSLYAMFSVVFGITVNLKFCRLDWEKEETIVKQSASAGLGGFSGFLAAIVGLLAVLLIPAPYAAFIRLAICLVLAGGTVVLYRWNNRIRLETL